MKKPVQSVATALYEEHHFRVTELAELWGLSPAMIRQLFQDEPGVIRIGKPSRREGREMKRSYFSIRIPATVAERVHKKITSAAA
jgi:predicted transcriptional regulator